MDPFIRRRRNAAFFVFGKNDRKKNHCKHQRNETDQITKYLASFVTVGNVVHSMLPIFFIIIMYIIMYYDAPSLWVRWNKSNEFIFFNYRTANLVE